LDKVDGAKDILWVSSELREDLNKDLDELIVACDKIIKDTTGKLGNDAVQALNAESDMVQLNVEFAELTPE